MTASSTPTTSTSLPHTGHHDRRERQRRMTRSWSVSTVISVRLRQVAVPANLFAQHSKRDKLLATFPSASGPTRFARILARKHLECLEEAMN